MSGLQETLHARVLDLCRKAPSDDAQGDQESEEVSRLVELLDSSVDKESCANTADANGVSCLAHAAEHGKTGVVKELLSRGANANKVSISGETALHFAARNGRVDTVKVLIEVPGIQLDVVSQQLGKDWTPLLEAAHGGHGSNALEICTMLLGKGANPYQKDSLGRDAIQLSTSTALKDLFREEGCIG